MPNTSLPILYSFRRCPYAIRARLAIAYSGIVVEVREVILKDKPDCMIQISAKGTVPVLKTIDNKVLDESLDIMDWALNLSDPDNWKIGLSDEQLLLGNQLIASNDNEFKDSLDRYKYYERYPERPQCDYRIQCESFLQTLDHRLHENRYLIADHITWADMSILPFIRQFAFTDKAWFDSSEYLHIKNWLQEFLSSHLFSRVMQKYPYWVLGDLPVTFPNDA